MTAPLNCKFQILVLRLEKDKGIEAQESFLRLWMHSLFKKYLSLPQNNF